MAFFIVSVSFDSSREAVLMIALALQRSPSTCLATDGVLLWSSIPSSKNNVYICQNK